MKFSSKIAWSLFLVLAGLFLSGCMTNVHDTELPWATPASWEGTAPLPHSLSGRYE
ncbi:MAG: hypothetical protein IJR99_01945 [Kiritimatiellae bacterium]|nr:hypothetical protein [Kiritimatiellia bacterium]